MMARSFINKAGEMIISTGGGKTTFAKNNFFAALDHFCDVTVPEAYIKTMKDVALVLMTKLIEKSPRDTGRFQCSWMPGVNKPNKEIPVFTTDDHGTAAMQRVIEALANLKYGDSLYISSNLAYALMLEYGWSGQAPNGVAEISVMEVEAEFGKKGGA
jgi:hypothetical protein